MKILHPALAAFSLLVCQPVFAEDQQITFAIPETTGLVSLGAFDSQGKLIATLSESEPTTAFTPDLNGLRIAWDGLDTSDQPVPAGDYTIRGWLISDSVKVEGRAYRFNDWVVDENSPRLRRIEAVLPLKGEAFALFAQDETSEPGLWIQESEDGTLGKKIPLPEGARFVAAGTGIAIFTISKGLLVAPLDGSAAIDLPVKISADAPAAVTGDILSIASEEAGKPTLRRLSIKDGSPVATIPAPAQFTRLATVKGSVAGSDGKKVWLLEGETFREIPLGDSPEVLGLSPGPGDTFWLLTRIADTEGRSRALLRQYDVTGDLLREFTPESDADNTRIFTDATDLRLFLTDTRKTEQITTGLHPTQAESDPPKDEVAKVVDWELFLDKTITDCSAFGLKDGKLVADAGSAALESTLKIHLAPSRLEKQTESLTLKAVGSTDGVWLEDEKGLRLLRVADTGGAARIAVFRGAQPDEAIIAIGDNAVVAEYQVTGLRKIFALDAGAVHIP